VYLTDLNVSSIVINSNGDIFAGTYSGGVYLSTDNGDEWTQINTGFTNLEIRSLVIDSSDNIFAGNILGVYKSSNNGNNWIKMGLNEVVSTFAVNSQNYIFAADFGGNVYKSTDSGISWTQNYVAPYVQTLLINSNDYVFAGTLTDGVYYSKNNGANWFPINSGLNNLDVRSLILNSQDELIAGTESGGVYRSLVPSDIKNEQTAPNVFSLFQNYPNPFNPQTKISWQSPVASHQTLKVYDVLGNEVASLINEFKNPGSYEVDFNASKFSSGIYFYQLKAGDFVETKKMILMK
jgi:ligand-binding sensor domain-containing protein